MPVENHRRPLVLIGMMGSGKTTVGALLAEMLERPFVDNDRAITEHAGMPAADLLRSDAKAFRDLEEQLIAEHLETVDGLVLSVGGGAVEREGTQHRLRETSDVVWLRASPVVLLRRVRAQGVARPMLEGDDEHHMTTLLTSRAPIYEDLAQLVVDVDAVTPEETAALILATLS